MQISLESVCVETLTNFFEFANFNLIFEEFIIFRKRNQFRIQITIGGCNRRSKDEYHFSTLIKQLLIKISMRFFLISLCRTGIISDVFYLH